MKSSLGKATLIRITDISKQSQFYDERKKYIGKCAWVKKLSCINSYGNVYCGWLCFCNPELRKYFGSDYEHAIYGFKYELVGKDKIWKII